jgi:hypothetical protein
LVQAIATVSIEFSAGDDDHVLFLVLMIIVIVIVIVISNMKQ